MLSLAAYLGRFYLHSTNTLNNHLHAAIFIVLSLVLVQRVLNARLDSSTAASKKIRHINWSILTLGIVAGCCVMCDLPALAWAGILPFAFFTRITGYAIGAIQSGVVACTYSYRSNELVRPW